MSPEDILVHFFITGKLQGNFTLNTDGLYHCLTRGEIPARLENLLQFCQAKGMSVDQSSLLVASAGEIANNSFDHNLGYWSDTAGCLMSWSATSSFLTVCICDRGRGIIESLKRVASLAKSEHEILELAFTQIISGRSPEKRGNGLKFVTKSVISSDKNSLLCISNGQQYLLGSAQLPNLLRTQNLPKTGTLTLIQWSL